MRIGNIRYQASTDIALLAFQVWNWPSDCFKNAGASTTCKAWCTNALWST